MLRGEIRLVEFPPALEGQANRSRPAILVSNDGVNQAAGRHGHGMVMVVPMMPETDSLYPFQVLIPAEESGMDRDTKAAVEQVRAVPVARIERLVGRIPPQRMQAIDEALRLHLAL